MAVEIIEALENANYNFQNFHKVGQISLILAKEQLNNAVLLLRKGYSLYDEVEPLLDKYGDIENVPEKKEEE